MCDGAFSNGNNGPFGYGENASASNWINVLLGAGTVASIGLAVWSWRLGRVPIAVANLVVGFIGATMAGISFVTQSDSNPYCDPSGWVVEATTAVALVVAAGAANVLLTRDVPADKTVGRRRVPDDSERTTV